MYRVWEDESSHEVRLQIKPGIESNEDVPATGYDYNI